VTLVLPLDAPDFRPAAEAVSMGFLAARAAEGRKLEVVVRRSDASDDSVLAQYQAAVDAGTRLIVGPMTRSGVTALVRNGKIAVPTLALNQPDGGGRLPASLYIFGLGVDAEARQVARQAWADSMRTAAVVGTAAPLSQRSREAFTDEWLLLGGKVTDVDRAARRDDPVQIRRSSTAIRRSSSSWPSPATRAAPAAVRRQPDAGLRDLAGQHDRRSGEEPRHERRACRRALDRAAGGSRDGALPAPQGLDGDLVRFYALGIDATASPERLIDGGRVRLRRRHRRIAVQGGG
jgi:outer membrane PBP1 activator LpoA protein